LVRAESLAESGDLQGAIALLSDAGAARSLRRPAERHVRQWFVLADLYERAGDVPMARTLFARVVAADPELADAAERLRALGAPRRTSRSRGSGSRDPGGRTLGSRDARSRGASGAKRPR
jgi:predicted TPR repeat methyltransferase